MPIDLDLLILGLFISVPSLGIVTIFYSRKKAAEIIIGAIGTGAALITGTDARLNIFDITGGKNNSNNNNSNSGNSSGSSNEGNNSKNGKSKKS